MVHSPEKILHCKYSFFNKQPEAHEEEEKGDNPIDMSWPKEGITKIIWYLISFPVMLPLYLTLPDVRNKEFTIFPSFKVPGIKTIFYIKNQN